MHTNVFNSFTETMAPIVALSKDMFAAQTEFFKSAKALTDKGLAKDAPEAMLGLVATAGAQSMTAGLKAARVAIAHASKSSKDFAKSGSVASTLPGMETLQGLHAKALTAVGESLTGLESLVGGNTRATRA